MIKLKTKKHKDLHNNYRENNSSCPHCLSKLILSDKGSWACSNDKLRFWESEFESYQRLDEIKQIDFLNKFNDIDQFLILFNKWNYMDKDGNRSNFTCDYTNTIGSPLITTTFIMPDPLMVKSIERKLGRHLTEEELKGEKILWARGNNYFSTFKKGRTKVVIANMQYPDDVV